ncbi:hypothetical protein HYC85_004458 [Camellia sinensis]|uniref:Ubiquitin receptor RAD23 n=1 Tax=Camellia sinensis TaxID=4442 RepID=A0A7J7HWM0_CAMSI|nr:hypothetical protein HYC85_004458 [Camellia sinensis]
MAVKKNIEDVQGKDNYPCGQQLLIHNGKVLKDESTLVENKITEDGFLVVMLSKTKTLGSSGSSSNQPASTTQPTSNPTPTSEAPVQEPDLNSNSSASNVPAANAPSGTYGQAANLADGNNLEETIQQIMDIGGGNWDKETVTRALRAAYNNPERAVDYLYSGIPEVAMPVNQATSERAETGPLNLFPQETISRSGVGGVGSLDFLRNNQQFQALRSMVHTNPQILQPMLQELGKQNPQLLSLIQEHHAEFLQLINEPLEGSEGNLFDQPGEMPLAVSVTPAEQEAIERLEAMGFDRALAIEAFFACDRNEELAINYLLENAGDYED